MTDVKFTPSTWDAQAGVVDAQAAAFTTAATSATTATSGTLNLLPSATLPSTTCRSAETLPAPSRVNQGASVTSGASQRSEAKCHWPET